MGLIEIKLPKRFGGVNKMGFKKWLKKYEKDDTAIGDLARDVRDDPNWPKRSTYRKIKNYFFDINACEGAVQSFEKAWVIYLEERKVSESYGFNRD